MYSVQILVTFIAIYPYFS